jgi:hypothetical protein
VKENAMPVKYPLTESAYDLLAKPFAGQITNQQLLDVTPPPPVPAQDISQSIIAQAARRMAGARGWQAPPQRAPNPGQWPGSVATIGGGPPNTDQKRALGFPYGAPISATANPYGEVAAQQQPQFVPYSGGMEPAPAQVLSIVPDELDIDKGRIYLPYEGTKVLLARCSYSAEWRVLASTEASCFVLNKSEFEGGVVHVIRALRLIESGSFEIIGEAQLRVAIEAVQSLEVKQSSTGSKLSWRAVTTRSCEVVRYSIDRFCGCNWEHAALTAGGRQGESSLCFEDPCGDSVTKYRIKAVTQQTESRWLTVERKNDGSWGAAAGAVESASVKREYEVLAAPPPAAGGQKVEVVVEEEIELDRIEEHLVTSANVGEAITGLQKIVEKHPEGSRASRMAIAAIEPLKKAKDSGGSGAHHIALAHGHARQERIKTSKGKRS